MDRYLKISSQPKTKMKPLYLYLWQKEFLPRTSGPCEGLSSKGWVQKSQVKMGTKVLERRRNKPELVAAAS